MNPRSAHPHDESTTPENDLLGVLLACSGGSWLDRYYPGPGQWMLHERSALRYLHEDLRAMTREELDNEQLRLEFRLLYDPAPDPWFRERHERIAEWLREVPR